MEQFMVHLVNTEGCPSGGKVLLSLYQFGALHLWLPISKGIKSKYAVNMQGWDGTEEGSLGPSDESGHTWKPQEGVPKT